MFTDLAAALDGGDPDAWAGVDLRVAFDPDTALKPPAAVLWLGRVLDFLVFVPVASTWLGLMVATFAYENTLHDPKLAGENFLQRWQSGFDGHVWMQMSFARIASVTFILIAIILLVAIAHFYFRVRAEEGRRAKVYRQLTEALTAAEKELAPVRLGAVGRVASEVGKVSAEVAATAKEIRKVGTAAERSQEAAGDAIERISGTMTAVHAAAADVAQAVMDMGEKLAEATAATTSVADTEAEFGEKLLDATDKLDTTVAGLADRLTVAVGAGETQLARSVADSSERVADSLSEGAAQVRDAIGELQSTAKKNVGEVSAAVTSLTDVKEATLKLPASLGHLDAEVARLNDAIERLTRSIDTMKARSPLSAPPPVPYRGPEGPAWPPRDTPPKRGLLGRLLHWGR
jgi:hypothetical protein